MGAKALAASAPALSAVRSQIMLNEMQYFLQEVGKRQRQVTLGCRLNALCIVVRIAVVGATGA